MRTRARAWSNSPRPSRESNVALVAATGTPSIAYRGPASGLAGALHRLRGSAGGTDLAAGIALGAGLLGGRDGHMVVLRAPEDAIPEVASAPGQLTV